MVLQKKLSDLRPEVRKRALGMLAQFEGDVSRGIIKMRDPFGARRRLFFHQVVAVQQLVQKNHQVPWAQRKSALLAVHALGLGKTITAILAIDRVRNLCPNPDESKMLVLCPKAVLSPWADALQSWTTLGDRVLVGEKQAQLTEAALEAAQVILTTPQVLVAAFKTFVYQGTSPEDLKRPKMQRFHHGVAPSNTARRAALQGALPPVHPIFALLMRPPPALALVVADELHKYCDPNNLSGHVVGMFGADAVYTMGTTATPVSRDPTQLAHLAKALNVQPPWLQAPRQYVEARNAKRINRETVDMLHDVFFHNAGPEHVDLPPRRYVVLEYEPWIGRGADGRTNQAVVSAHNEMLASAQNLAASSAQEALELAQGKWGERERAVFKAAVALGHYEISPTLGRHGAAAVNEDPALFDEAAAAPSECVKLILRMLRSRQAGGHPRIVVYSECVTHLQLLQRFLEADGTVGELFLYEGKLSCQAREKLVHDFLHCASGVLLLSSAGAIGLTICPGCEVLFSVGSLPWNATDVDQAFGRVHRIGQTQPVEIVQFVARGGITAAKMALHEDKRERLEAAVRDGNFENFGKDGTLWRWTLKVLSSCALLDERGNYRHSAKQMAAARAWMRTTEALDAKGLPHPPPPPGLPKRPRLAAHAELPPVSYPIVELGT